MGMNYNLDSEHASKYGINEAIILNNFIFWIKHNKANQKHFYDGRYWTYNTVKAFSELFPFFSKSQIRTALKNLKDKGAILTGEYNKLSFDRTTWYALSDEVFAKSIDNTELSKIANGVVENRNCDLRNLANGVVENSTTIPDINTDIKTDNKTTTKTTVVDSMSKEFIQECQNKINTVINDEVSAKAVSELIHEHGVDKINKYLDNWKCFDLTHIKSNSAFFITAVKDGYAIPAQKYTNDNRNNFMEREYNFDNSIYANVRNSN